MLLFGCSAILAPQLAHKGLNKRTDYGASVTFRLIRTQSYHIISGKEWEMCWAGGGRDILQDNLGLGQSPFLIRFDLLRFYLCLR